MSVRDVLERRISRSSAARSRYKLQISEPARRRHKRFNILEHARRQRETYDGASLSCILRSFPFFLLFAENSTVVREAPDMREGEGRERVSSLTRGWESMPPFIDRLLRMARRVLVFLTLFFFLFSFRSLFSSPFSPSPLLSVCLIKLSQFDVGSYAIFILRCVNYSYLSYSPAFSSLCIDDNTMRGCDRNER